ncbi:MAG: aspartyl-tRNA(Asn)/glutamyl-tRNA(Gln) amidotransferase subunit B, partial [Sulfitobacter sp.]
NLVNNWIRVEVLGRLNRDDLDIRQTPISPAQLAAIIQKIGNGIISGKIAKSIFDAVWAGDAVDVDEYIKTNDLTQVSDDSALAPMIDQIINDNPKQVEQYLAGKTKLIGFFVGQVMKQTGGKANPQQVNDLLMAKLK